MSAKCNRARTIAAGSRNRTRDLCINRLTLYQVAIKTGCRLYCDAVQSVLYTSPLRELLTVTYSPAKLKFVPEFLISWELRFSVGQSRSIYQSPPPLGAKLGAKCNMARKISARPGNRNRYLYIKTANTLPCRYKSRLVLRCSTKCPIHISPS